MATTNRDRIRGALDALREGLAPFVERNLRSRNGRQWAERLDREWQFPLDRSPDGSVRWDSLALLRAMTDNWQTAFQDSLGRSGRAWVGELIEVRHDHAHEKHFDSDRTLRSLDTARLLLTAVGAARHAAAVGTMHQEQMRAVFEQSARNRVKQRSTAAEAKPQTGLHPWREVVQPHEDVASGNFQQAQFAANLAPVHAGAAGSEYGDPVEFFRRTFLTEGLKRLLKGAMRRLSGTGGDPVVELQTNFGGGKTHSMLALYHLFGPAKPDRLPGVDSLLAESGIGSPPPSRRAVLVGSEFSPDEPDRKDDGTVTRTLWGELAWQLGGPEGYRMVARSDRSGVSPGSGMLATLLSRYAPCIVLVDEWVALLRGLYRTDGLPSGSFDANLTFVQALTEATRAAPKTMVVASLPASQIEIGGEGGEQALQRLKHTFGRMESAWLAASAEEGFEIVRRRLFEPITAKSDFISRDAVIRAFITMYGKGGREFPQGCGEADYRRRMERTYPIHPEFFDRLMKDWGGLDRFQRTRGVLRFMASVISALWERGDTDLLILPSSVPLDHQGVSAELLQYLDGSWSTVAHKDVDGPQSTPVALDREFQRFGRRSAARRVARTVFVGSAPVAKGRNRGLDDRQLRLGCAEPGESVSTFGDALRHLSDRATYLYQDGSRHWFATLPSVARLAEDRAAALEPDEVDEAITKRLREERRRGEFERVHIAPASPADVPDETDAGLVILGPKFPHAAKADGDRATPAAREFLENGRSGPRIYRNSLLFLAADARGLARLRDAMRRRLAWRSICSDADLGLEEAQKRQAQAKRQEAEQTVEGLIPQVWSVALAPTQEGASAPVGWERTKLAGEEPGLAAAMSKRMAAEEKLVSSIGPVRLRMALDEGKLWRGADHLGTKQLLEDLASYPHLPRLRNRKTLAGAIARGAAELLSPSFAYAEGLDAEAGRYLGLRSGETKVRVEIGSVSLVVRPEAAARQQQQDAPPEPVVEGSDPPGPDDVPAPTPGEDLPEAPQVPRRFFGSVKLDPDRASRDFGKVAEEVLDHLNLLPKKKVTITVEIEAEAADGFPEDARRRVEENCRTLKFATHGFETD